MPLVFYTNGYDHFHWEYDFYPPVKVYGFPTKLDMEWMDQRRAERKPLSAELIDTKIVGRDYQIAAIRSVLEKVEAKRRKFLLVMATGTGKTRVAAGLADVLLRARWAKRILFLVDRIALQEQALAAGPHEADRARERTSRQTGASGDVEAARIVTAVPVGILVHNMSGRRSGTRAQKNVSQKRGRYSRRSQPAGSCHRSDTGATK